MSLEVKLFVHRRVVYEAAKITEENLQKISNWTSGDREVQRSIYEGSIGKWVVRRGDSKFELLSEGEFWGLYEPILR